MTSWTEYARQFIATGDKAYLQQAISSCNDGAVVVFLRHPGLEANKQIQPSLFEPLIDGLIDEGRKEEAVVVNLLGFQFVAHAMAELETYDRERQAFILRTCQALAEQSTAFEFRECEAFFVGLLATGAAKLRKDEESFPLFERAIGIARDVVAAGQDTYTRLLAGLLHNNGNALRFAGRFAEARQRLEESVAICQRLASDGDKRHKSQLASTLSDLSAAYGAEGCFREAEPFLLEAITIHRQIVLTGARKKERRSYAGVLSNLSMLYIEQRRFHAARQACEEALQIRRQLAVEEPEVYAADVAATLSNLGMLLDDLRDYASSVSVLREAVAIRRSLAKDQPEVFEIDLATSLNNLANSLLVTGSARDIRDAFATYNEALEIRRRLAAKNPQLYEAAVVQTLGNLAALRRTVGQSGMAIEQFREVAAMLKRLCAERPQEYLPKLAGCLGNLGQTLYLTGDCASARETLAEAVSVWKILAATEPEAYEGQLAGTLNDLSLVLSEMGSDQEALQVAAEAITLAEKSEDHVHLSKGDVSGAYWLVIADRVRSDSAEAVYEAVSAVRDPITRIGSHRKTGRLADAHRVLREAERTSGRPIRLVIVQKLKGTNVLLGVLSSDAGDEFRYEISDRFFSQASPLWNLLHQPFTDHEARTRGVRDDEVGRLGKALWNSLPAFLRDALHPENKHDVLLCGDPDSVDFPWEAIRFGPTETDWLGVHRHLARIHNLAHSTLAVLQPVICGKDVQSAAIICPWDIPGQPALDGARDEAVEVGNLLRSAGYRLFPDGNPLLSRSANKNSVLRVMVSSPAVIHFAGHGDLVGSEEVLVLWNEESSSGGYAVFDRKSLMEAKATASRQLLFPSKPVVVLNACWAGRSRAFGGQREDLASAYLDEGASCVIACPTPVHDDMGRMLATLLYVPVMQDRRGLGYTFARVRAIVEKKFRGTNWWWTWFWMRFYGNPFVHIGCLSNENGLHWRDEGTQCRSRAIDLMPDIV